MLDDRYRSPGKASWATLDDRCGGTEGQAARAGAR